MNFTTEPRESEGDYPQSCSIWQWKEFTELITMTVLYCTYYGIVGAIQKQLRLSRNF